MFARHARHGEATRPPCAHGARNPLRNPIEYSNSLTAVLMPEGHDADAFRRIVLEHFDMSLGTGSQAHGRVFRIGHLGDFNDLTLMGTLAGVEMGLGLANVPHRSGGVDAAMASLSAAANVVSPPTADRAVELA